MTLSDDSHVSVRAPISGLILKGSFKELHEQNPKQPVFTLCNSRRSCRGPVKTFMCLEGAAKWNPGTGFSAVGVFALVQSTLADLDEADDDDERQRQELRRGKEVLHSGGRLHAVAVHKRQQHCRGRETDQQRL